MSIIRKLSKIADLLGYLATMLLPWAIRRPLLVKLYGYEIHPTARIGLSWFRPRELKMEAHSRIGHLNVCKGLDRVELGEHAVIEKLNWIYGFPSGIAEHFTLDGERVPSLLVGDHSAITSRHIIDCTNTIRIGRFATVAGYRSQFLTHSIDIQISRQRSKPILIGDYTFVGTSVVILGGSILPDRSVLAAGAVLNKELRDPGYLYAGVPAKAVKKIERDALYFSREIGFVY